jgi:hypothetical protein
VSSGRISVISALPRERATTHTLQINNNTTRLGRPVPPGGLGTLCFGSPTSILKHCKGSERGPWSQLAVQTSTRQLPRWSPLLASSSFFSPTGRSKLSSFLCRMASIYSSLASLLFADKYSDLTIACGGRTFQAHRAVVCSQSAFFAKACDSGFKVPSSSHQRHRVRADTSC